MNYFWLLVLLLAGRAAYLQDTLFVGNKTYPAVGPAIRPAGHSAPLTAGFIYKKADSTLFTGILAETFQIKDNLGGYTNEYRVYWTCHRGTPQMCSTYVYRIYPSGKTYLQKFYTYNGQANSHNLYEIVYNDSGSPEYSLKTYYIEMEKWEEKIIFRPDGEASFIGIEVNGKPHGELYRFDEHPDTTIRLVEIYDHGKLTDFENTRLIFLDSSATPTTEPAFLNIINTGSHLSYHALDDQQRKSSGADFIVYPGKYFSLYKNPDKVNEIIELVGTTTYDYHDLGYLATTYREFHINGERFNETVKYNRSGDTLNYSLYGKMSFCEHYYHYSKEDTVPAILRFDNVDTILSVSSNVNIVFIDDEINIVDQAEWHKIRGTENLNLRDQYIASNAYPELKEDLFILFLYTDKKVIWELPEKTVKQIIRANFKL